MMSPGERRLALIVHLMCSVGWVGAVVVYLVLAVAAATSPEMETVRAAWMAMELAGWWALVPLASAALFTGIIASLGTPWGLFRHYWVVVSLALTVLCTVILVLHMPAVSHLAAAMRLGDSAERVPMGG